MGPLSVGGILRSPLSALPSRLPSLPAHRRPAAFHPRRYEKAAGKTVSEARMSVSDIALIGLQVCLGLKHINDAGLVHGDIKSDNILMKDGVAKVSGERRADGQGLFTRWRPGGKVLSSPLRQQTPAQQLPPHRPPCPTPTSHGPPDLRLRSGH